MTGAIPYVSQVKENGDVIINANVIRTMQSIFLTNIFLVNSCYNVGLKSAFFLLSSLFLYSFIPLLLYSFTPIDHSLIVNLRRPCRCRHLFSKTRSFPHSSRIWRPSSERPPTLRACPSLHPPRSFSLFLSLDRQWGSWYCPHCWFGCVGF